MQGAAARDIEAAATTTAAVLVESELSGALRSVILSTVVDWD